MQAEAKHIARPDSPVPIWAGLTTLLLSIGFAAPFGDSGAPVVTLGFSVLLPLLAVWLASAYGRSVTTMLVVLAPFLCLRWFVPSDDGALTVVTGQPLPLYFGSFMAALVVSRRRDEALEPLDANHSTAIIGAIAALLSFGVALHYSDAENWAVDISISPQWTGALILFWLTLSRPMRLRTLSYLLSGFAVTNIIVGVLLTGLSASGLGFTGDDPGWALVIERTASLSWLAAPPGDSWLTLAELSWGGGWEGLLAGVTGSLAGYLLYPILTERRIGGRGGKDLWLALFMVLAGAGLIAVNPADLGSTTAQYDLSGLWPLPLGSADLQPVWWIFAVAACVFTSSRNRLYLAPMTAAILLVLVLNVLIQAANYPDFELYLPGLLTNALLILLGSIFYGAALWLWLFRYNGASDGYRADFIGPREQWLWAVSLSLIWLSFDMSFAVTDYVDLVVSLYWFAPILAAYLGASYGFGIVKSIAWLGLLLAPAIAYDVTDTFKIGLGLGPGIWLACLGTAWLFGMHRNERASLADGNDSLLRMALVGGALLVAGLSFSIWGGDEYGRLSATLGLDNTIYMGAVALPVLAAWLPPARAGIVLGLVFAAQQITAIVAYGSPFPLDFEIETGLGGLELDLLAPPSINLLPVLAAFIPAAIACRRSVGWDDGPTGPPLLASATILIIGGLIAPYLAMVLGAAQDALWQGAIWRGGALQVASVDFVIVTGSYIESESYLIGRTPLVVILGVAAGLGLSERWARRATTIALAALFVEAAIQRWDVFTEETYRLTGLVNELIHIWFYFWIGSWVGRRMAEQRASLKTRSELIEATQ